MSTVFIQYIVSTWFVQEPCQVTAVLRSTGDWVTYWSDSGQWIWACHVDPWTVSSQLWHSLFLGLLFRTAGRRAIFDNRLEVLSDSRDPTTQLSLERGSAQPRQGSMSLIVLCQDTLTSPWGTSMLSRDWRELLALSSTAHLATPAAWFSPSPIWFHSEAQLWPLFLFLSLKESWVFPEYVWSQCTT